MMAYLQLSLLGCPGYVVIGNSLTEPMTGHVLFGEDSERAFYTPMFYTEKFEFLRRVEIMRKLFYSTGTAEHPSNDPVIQQTQPVIQQLEPVEETPAVEEGTSYSPRVIEISKKKGRKVIEGQMMFDLAGGIM